MSRSELLMPLIYEIGQYAVGAKRWQKHFLRDLVRPKSGQRILDLGCGTGEILRLLPPVEYVGFDVSEARIQAAMRKFGARARFVCKDISVVEPRSLGRFDIVMAVGILHHVGDDRVNGLIALAKQVLKPGGKLYTADPCFFDGQPWLARYVVRMDRGRNVRHFDEYAKLARREFSRVDAWLSHGLLPFPHSVCVLECLRDDI